METGIREGTEEVEIGTEEVEINVGKAILTFSS
jgi:hypothetical protein